MESSSWLSHLFWALRAPAPADSVLPGGSTATGEHRGLSVGSRGQRFKPVHVCTVLTCPHV